MKINRLIFLFAFFFVHSTYAAILWTGGEDIDFPNGGLVCFDTNARRVGYARGGVGACSIATQNIISTVFPGGPVTSAWLSSWNSCAADTTSQVSIGVTRSGTNSSLWVGTASSSSTKVALWKYDGTTWTQLAAESGNSLAPGWTMTKLDMEITSYGASATVNIYVNGSASAKLSYTGNVLAGGATDFDQVIVKGRYSGYGYSSEIIVSTADTRKMSLITMSPNAAGSTNQWTGSYSNINPNTINDAINISNNNSGDIFQANLSDLPSTNFQILGVKLSGRMTQTGAGLTSVALGVRTNSTNSIPSAVAQAATWGTTETYYSSNPVTSVLWTPTEINALQIHLQSAP